MAGTGRNLNYKFYRFGKNDFPELYLEEHGSIGKLYTWDNGGYVLIMSDKIRKKIFYEYINDLGLEKTLKKVYDTFRENVKK